jgi:hypothetical protein
VDALTYAYNVTRINVAVTPANISQDLTYSNGTFSGILVVPTGAQTLTATAYVGAQQVGTGTVTVTVTANTTSSAYIKILDATGSPPAPDHGPYITSLTASKNNPNTGESVALAATAVDPDGDALAYQWSEDCSGGTFTAPSAATTSWSSTMTGACNLTLTVTSKALKDTKAVQVVVFGGSGGSGGGPTGAVSVTGTFVAAPSIGEVRLYTYSPGLSCDIYRSIADGDCRQPLFPTQKIWVYLNYSTTASTPNVTLTDNCGGSTTPNSTYSSYAYFNWTAPANTGACLLTATLSGDGMTDSFPVAVLVSGCLDDEYERNDTSSSASSLSFSYPNTATTITASGLYANNDDWYVFSPPTTSVKVTLTTSDTIGLELYKSDATTLVATGTGSLNATGLTSSQSYYLHVKPGALAATCGSKYDLSIQSL